MSPRHRLANRRAIETIAIEHEGQRYKIGLGREMFCDGSCGHASQFGDIQVMCGNCGGSTKARGPVLEVFLNGQKPNSPVDVLASDGAILMSLLIQYGHPIEEIAKSMKRNPDGSPSSPLGRAAALIMEASNG